jgi:hypothetical protein
LSRYDDPERELVSTLKPHRSTMDHARTGLASCALDLDWARLTTLAIQHRVEGLLVDAATAAGFDDQMPPSALSTLRRRAELAEAREGALRTAFERLLETGLFPLDTLVVYKGAALVHLYDEARHRMISDIDLLTVRTALPTLRKAFAASGYRERATPSGPAFVGPPPAVQIGCDFVVFDIHLDPLPRFHRPRESPAADWLELTAPLQFAGTECKTLIPGSALLIALVYLGEHAVSWVRACLEDDLRLIKVIDVELLCQSTSIDAASLMRHAQERQLVGACALGLAVVLSTRGALPAPLLPLSKMAETASQLLDYVAIPGGAIAKWLEPFSVRAFATDRSSQALRLMPTGQQHRRMWYDAHLGPNTGAENVMVVTTAAQDLVTTGSCSLLGSQG